VLQYKGWLHYCISVLAGWMDPLLIGLTGLLACPFYTLLCVARDGTSLHCSDIRLSLTLSMTVPTPL